MIDILARFEQAKGERGFAKLARRIQQIRDSGAWRASYRTFTEWVGDSKSSGMKPYTLWLYLEVIDKLGSLSDDELDEIGISKCRGA